MKYKNDMNKRRDRYAMNMGEMKHASAPKKCNPLKAQQADVSRLHMRPMEHRGYPKEAFNYKY